MKCVAFIPARKGSKGIPGKNKKLFHGKPLVQWSIEQAKESKLFDNIIVSTDDPDILKIAKDLEVTGVERDPEHAGDEAKIDDVMIHYFEKNECDYISLLQPTSPLRSVADLKEGFKYIKMKKYWSVVGVTWNPILGWIDKVAKLNGRMVPTSIYLVNDRPNRQNRDNFYIENGALYWTKFSTLMEWHNRIGAPNFAKLIPMPPERSIDIDSPFDWFLAEKAFDYKGVA
jgi:CMP-N,N'-diacetyllegionaminic acid synthase